MNPDAQRIAIAKACGWTCCGQVPGLQPHGLVPWRKIGDYTSQQVLNHEVPMDTLPDYLNDLDAIHGAVMSLDFDQRKTFRKELQYMVAPATRPGPACGIVLMCGEDYDKWFHASAAMRSEAFLKALNLWQE